MSCCVKALNPASSSVAAPTSATANCAAGASENRTCVRAIKYTPAVTIVAAWRRALVGVGPAIASGNQTCSGSCADLPTAPPSSKRAATNRISGSRVPLFGGALHEILNPERA